MVWQGEADGLVPLAHGEQLASQLPAGTLHRVPGAGHFLHAAHGQDHPVRAADGPRLRSPVIGRGDIPSDWIGPAIDNDQIAFSP